MKIYTRAHILEKLRCMTTEMNLTYPCGDFDVHLDLLKELVVGLLEELNGFGQVEDSHVVLFHLDVGKAEVVEVVLRMGLVSF